MTDDRLSYSFFPWPLRTTLPCRVPLLFGDWILISIAPAVDEREAGLRPVKAQDEAHGGGLTGAVGILVWHYVSQVSSVVNEVRALLVNRADRPGSASTSEALSRCGNGHGSRTA